MAAAYYGLARLGLLVAVAHPVVSSAWPPTGVALAILLLFGLRLWPGIALGAFLLNWTSGVPVAGAAAIAAGNTLEAVIPTILLGRVGFRPSLERIRDVLWLAVLGALLSTTVSATIGVAGLWVSGAALPGGVARLWVAWWSGDAMGDLVVAPLLLTWWPLRAERRWRSVLLVGIVLLAGTWLVFESGFPYVYPLFPLMMWAALRLGPRGTATASAVIAGFALNGTLQGIGPFADSGLARNLAYVQLFVAVFSLSGLLLAALSAEREHALRATREAEQHNLLLAEEAGASEEAFRLLVEGVRDYAIFWLDALGRVVNWNAGAQHLKGYAADEILGQSFSRFYTREDVAAGAPAKELRDAAEAGVCRAEGWRVRKDGSRFWAEVQLNAVRDGNGALLGFAKLVRDLSERRKAQERLSREAAFVQLLQGVAVAANQAGGVEEALQTAVNDVCRVIGWPVGHVCLASPEGGRGLSSTSLWYEDDPALNATFRRVTEASSWAPGVSLPGQVLARRQAVWVMNLAQDSVFTRGDAARASGLRAGFAFPVLSGDEVAAVLEFFARDAVPPDPPLLDVMAHIGTQLGRVIERTRAAQALRRSELRFRAVAESAADGIVTVDGEGRIVYWNPAAEAIFGRTEREMLGQPLAGLMVERYRSAYVTGLDQTRQRGSGPLVGRTVPVRGLRGDGSEFPMELSLAQWQVGEHSFYTAIVRDVTARANAEAELSQSRERLRELAARIESTREAERTRIAREIHDELGQALTALKMDLAWLKGRLPKRGPELVAKVGGMTEVVDATAQTVQRLATELRPGVLDQLGLPAAIRWQTKEFQARTGIGCDLDLKVEDEHRLDDAPATAAFRILQEALTNVARHSEATRVHIRFCLSPRELHLTVEDNGRGISEAALHDPHSLGLLGLHERAAILGGTLTVQGAPDQGTTVSLTLPRT